MRIKYTSALALPLAFVAGCGGGGGSTDIEGTLRLADRTDVELSRMMNAAVGAEMFQAMGQVDQFGDTFDPDPCPTVSVTGQTATITGGCTTANGMTIGGMAIVTNPVTWDQIEYNFGDESTYEMIGLTLDQSGIIQTYDGLIVVEDFSKWDADVTTNAFGVQLRSDVYMSCSASGTGSGTCRVSGSGLELIGVGGVTVSGTQRVADQMVVTDITLRGTDSLAIHVEANCISWEFSDSDRMYPGPACPP